MSGSKANAKELSIYDHEDDSQDTLVKQYYELDKKIDFIMEKISKRKRLSQKNL